MTAVVCCDDLQTMLTYNISQLSKGGQQARLQKEANVCEGLKVNCERGVIG